MENAERTRQFLSVMAERKAALEGFLTKIFSSTTDAFVCEFGSGHGHFLTAYAQAHPATLCVGLDIESARVERAQRKQARAKAERLHFLHADAKLFLQLLPAAATFTEVFILFPDPWPKKRHHKHRLIQPDFLDQLRAHSTETTRIFFRTDYEPCFEDARVIFGRHSGWQIVDETWPFEHETVFQSRAVSFRSLVVRPRPAAP